MKTALVWIAGILLWPVVAVGLLIASLYIHVPTAMGRAAAEDAINHLASKHLPGRLHVDSVDELQVDYVSASGFAAYDLDDVEVIAVEHASMRMSVWTWLFGDEVKFWDMKAQNGHVTIREGRESKVSISEVFSREDPPGQTTTSSTDLDLGWIWAENIRLAIQMISRPLTFQVRTASLHVERRGEDPTKIDLENVNATMLEPSPLGIEVGIVGASGRIRPKTDRVVDLSSGVCIGDEPLQARVVYRPGPPKEARIVLDYESGLGFLASIGFRIGDLISGPLEVDERELPGSPPNCEGESPAEMTSGEGEDGEDRRGRRGNSQHPAAGEDGVLTDEELEDWNDQVDEDLDDADEQAEEALEAAGGL